MTRLGSTLLVTLVLVVGTACSKGGDAPSTPTGPSPTASTRILGLTGTLAFGDVAVGSSAERTVTITNSGTAPLVVSGMTVSGGLSSMLTASWTSGSVAPGTSQNVLVRVSPTSPGGFNGSLTVNGDQTSGVNTMPISVNAVGFNANGTFQGRYVVERCDGTGSIQDLLCSANRGLYPVGASLPIRLVLTQSGGAVSGRMEFGQVVGTVTGTVSPGGVLSLQGTATNNELTIAIANWATPIVGDSLTGTIRVDISARSIFGVAAITARLSEVRR